MNSINWAKKLAIQLFERNVYDKDQKILKCKNTFSYFLTFPVNNSIVNLLECFKCKYISKFDHKKVNVKK